MLFNCGHTSLYLGILLCSNKTSFAGCFTGRNVFAMADDTSEHNSIVVAYAGRLIRQNLSIAKLRNNHKRPTYPQGIKDIHNQMHKKRWPEAAGVVADITPDNARNNARCYLDIGFA